MKKNFLPPLRLTSAFGLGRGNGKWEQKTRLRILGEMKKDGFIITLP